MFLLFYILSVVAYFILIRCVIITDIDVESNVKISLQQAIILLIVGLIPIMNTILCIGILNILLFESASYDGSKLLKKILFIKDK